MSWGVIPLDRPFHRTAEREPVLKMESRRISAGQVAEESERVLARLFGWKHCVVVDSGTSALSLSMRALGGKRVVVPTLTCPNVLQTVPNAGSQPVFVDFEPEAACGKRAVHRRDA